MRGWYSKGQFLVDVIHSYQQGPKETFKAIKKQIKKVINVVRNSVFTPEEMKLLGKVIREIKLKRTLRFSPNTASD